MLVEAGIETFDNFVRRLHSRFQAIDDAGPRALAMRDKGPDMPLGLGDRRPVSRPIDRVLARQQFIEEAIYAAISPSGGANDAGDHPMTWSPLNRMPLSGKRKSTNGSRWCPGVCTASKRHFPPTISAPSVTTMSGAKSQIAAFLDPASPRRPPACGPKPIARRAGRRFQRLGRRRVVAVGVGNQDMGDLLLGEARQQGRDMLLELRPGIDDRDLALADDIGAGP